MLNFMTFLTYISHLKYTCFKNNFPFAFKSVLIHGRRAKNINEANANFWCPGLRSPELTKFIIRTILQMVLSKNQLQTHIYLEDDNIKFSLVHIKPPDSKPTKKPHKTKNCFCVRTYPYFLWDACQASDAVSAKWTKYATPSNQTSTNISTVFQFICQQV